MLGAFHEQAFAHTWGSISQRLLEDLTMRRRIMKERGLAAMLRTLSPAITIRSGRHGIAVVEISGHDTEMELSQESSVLFTPSFFTWPHTQAFFMKASSAPHCTITYALPPLSVRARRLGDGRELVKVFHALADPIRLRMAELLRERDLSTRELAGFLNQSEAVVSRHLRKLLQCGLVDQERSGYFVMYRLRKSAVKRFAGSFSALA